MGSAKSQHQEIRQNWDLLGLPPSLASSPSVLSARLPSLAGYSSLSELS